MSGERGAAGTDGGDRPCSSQAFPFPTIINYFPKCFIALLQLFRLKQIFSAVRAEAEQENLSTFNLCTEFQEPPKTTANANADPVKGMTLTMTEVLSELSSCQEAKLPAMVFILIPLVDRTDYYSSP